jgi:hypothetical protein
MERKECKAEGKTSACQKTSFISAMVYFILRDFFYVMLQLDIFVDLTPLGIFVNFL